MTDTAPHRHVLLLAGGGESHALSMGLAGMEGVTAHALWAAPLKGRGALSIPTEEMALTHAALAREMNVAEPQVVIDATHPFDIAASRAAETLCAAHGVDRVQVLRRPWQPGVGDHWVPINTIAEAAPHIPDGARVFVTTGRESLEALEALAHCQLFIRQLHLHDSHCPLKNAEYVFGEGPFSVSDEIAIFSELEIDWLLTRNTGGGVSNTKLTAARHLKMPVAMLERPTEAHCPPVVESAAAALEWLAAV